MIAVRPAATALLALLPPLTSSLSAQQQPDRAAIEQLVRELDDLFERGDVRGYLARFDPDEPGAVAMRGRHLERLVALSAKRHCSSTIVRGPQVVGDRTLVRLHHVIRLSDPAASAERERIEDSYLAVRSERDGSVVPTFAIEIAPATRCVQDSRLRCPPCNYEIGGVDGFLCVPLRRSRTLALEAASFYLLGTDVVCDVSVRIDTQRTKAIQAAQCLANALHKVDPDTQVGVPERWLPPKLAADPPSGLDGARITVQLPADRSGGGGERSTFHVVTFGSVQHVLLVRGHERSLARHRERIEALLASYTLLELDCNDAEAAVRPLQHHTGGMLTGDSYRNRLFDVAMRGPEGWRAEQRVGGAMFRVRWTGPRRSRLWLTGQTVPDGIAAWNRQYAEHWLDHHLRTHGLAIDPNDDSGWRADANGVSVRTCTLLTEQPARPDSPQRRLLHVQVYPDLLLLVDGFGASDADEDAIRKAIATLRRR